jgi:hypothetical protein
MLGHQLQSMRSGKQIVVAKASIDDYSLISRREIAVGM